MLSKLYSSSFSFCLLLSYFCLSARNHEGSTTGTTKFLSVDLTGGQEVVSWLIVELLVAFNIGSDGKMTRWLLLEIEELVLLELTTNPSTVFLPTCPSKKVEAAEAEAVVSGTVATSVSDKVVEEKSWFSLLK